jgi:uncharacterized membrane protein
MIFCTRIEFTGLIIILPYIATHYIIAAPGNEISNQFLIILKDLGFLLL